MHFSSALVAAAAIYLAPLAHADDVETPSAASSSTADLASSQVARPTFTPAAIKAPFIEQFTDDWETRWKASHAKKESEEEWTYVGKWEVEEPIVVKGIEGDKGLVLQDKAAHHAISAKFDKKIDNKGKTLVVQYEVKLQEGLECGGAYMKLLKENKALQQEEFSNASPYVIMFGPDKCGTTNKVHFIFKHKNPKTGEYEEKHMTSAPMITIDKLTHLYTLIVKPDNSFQVKIDGAAVKNGTLLEDFSPSVEPAKEIDDPKDKKPEDWVEDPKVADPEAKKPDDWDEDAPFEVVDDEAEKPEDWLDDEPQLINDPEAQKPEDWDDEEDGDWAPPQVPNPKCAEASGCGKWERPTKRNPEYKGKWTAPLIDNPLYKGLWKAKQILNPDYFQAKDVAAFEPMGALGIELWSMQAKILFDNIYIGHSIEDAEAFQKETFDKKHGIEITQQAIDAAAAAKDEPKLDDGMPKFKDDPVKYVKEKVEDFIAIAREEPLEAIKIMPEVAGGISALVVTILALVIGSIGFGAKSPKVQETAQQVKDKAVEAKDQAVDAVATGAETAQAEVNKRTTRSSGGVASE